MTQRRNNMIANRYLATRHIGQGGMADVFVATDTILNREVAVKILRGDLSNDPTAVLRFEREALASTSLSHPNIVDIYDVGEDRGHHFIVMEYVRGITLKQLINKRKALCKEEAVDIMKQTVSAIVEAHAKGIIHRDIKSQNILVKDDGTIKVVDFGIAIAQDSLQLTQKDSVMGSVHYLAPELAKGEQASVQSDIYALGIVFFELLSGDVPFKAQQAVQVALMHMREALPDIRTINPEIPVSIANIINKACAKNKNLRYNSAKAMLDDLNTCLNPNRLNERPLVFDFVQEPKKVEKKTEYVAIEDKTEPKRKKVKKPFNFVALLIVLLSFLSMTGIYFMLSLTGVFKPAAKLVEVPDLIGETVMEAKTILSESDLQLDINNIVYELTDTYEKGIIFEQSPNSIDEVAKGTKIAVKVSSGIGIYLENYVGMNINTAKEKLSKYPNMSVSVVAIEDSGQTPGTVVSQELMAANTRFNPDTYTQIRLVYASYPSYTIPSGIIGMNIDEAKTMLEQEGMQVVLSNLDTTSLTEEEINNLETGIVIKTNPDINEEYIQTDDAYITLYYY